jgi:7-alpha-hydroxysteroid dehydrogenase
MCFRIGPESKKGGTPERMADLFSMKNRVVLVTGASRGLGRDMAATLGAAGATVLCAGRTVKELEVTARAIKRKGG